MAMKFGVHFKCKGCGKLFSVAPNGIKEDFDGYDTMAEAVGAFGALMMEEKQGTVVRVHPCPGCRRAFNYHSSDAFIQIPLAYDMQNSSTIGIKEILDVTSPPSK